jgi:hypothetical protein
VRVGLPGLVDAEAGVDNLERLEGVSYLKFIQS